MKVLIGILSIFLITGCAVNFHDDGVCEGMSCKSSIVSRKLNPGTTAMGTVYALPKQLLELKISRKKITKNVLEKELFTRFDFEMTMDNTNFVFSYK